MAETPSALSGHVIAEVVSRWVAQIPWYLLGVAVRIQFGCSAAAADQDVRMLTGVVETDLRSSSTIASRHVKTSISRGRR